MQTTVADAHPTEQHAHRGRGVAMLIVASLLWSLSGMAVKYAQMGPVSFAFWRSISAGAATALLAILWRRGTWPSAKWMALSVCTYTATVTFLIAAMTVSTAAAGIILQYTGPVFCAMLAWALQGRHLSRRTAIALAIASAGVIVMVLGGRSGGWAGPTLGLLSGVFFGSQILLLDKINEVSRGKVDVFRVVMFNNLGAAILLSIVGSIVPRESGGGLSASTWQLAIVLIAGVFQLAAPYVLFQLALRYVEPVDASLLVLLEPVLNPIWVAMSIGERPEIATIIGGMAILIALVIEVTKPSDPVAGTSS